MALIQVETSSSIRRNSLWLLLARLTAYGSSILFVILTARRLNVEAFGQFTVIAALVMVANTFTTFGTDTFLIREIAKAQQVTSVAARALGLQLALSCLWWLAILFLHPNPLLLLYSLALFPLALLSVASALLRALERMDLFWSLSLANGFVQITAAFFSKDVWTLCASLVLGQILIACLGLWICTSYLPRSNLFPSMDFYPLLRAVWPFAAIMTLSVLSQRLGILFVFAIEGDVATGLFSSAARLVEGLKFGHFAVLGALMPALSRGAANSRNGFRVGLGGMLGLSILMAGGVMLFAHLLIHFLFGQEYMSAAGLLSVLSWILVPYTISAFVSIDLVARGREHAVLKAMLFSLLLFLGLYFVMINKYGLYGAACAALVGEISQAAILIWVARRTTQVSPSHLDNANETI